MATSDVHGPEQHLPSVGLRAARRTQAPSAMSTPSMHSTGLLQRSAPKSAGPITVSDRPQRKAPRVGGLPLEGGGG